MSKKQKTLAEKEHTIKATPVANPEAEAEKKFKLAQGFMSVVSLFIAAGLAIGLAIMWYGQLFRTEFSFLTKKLFKSDFVLPMWGSLLLCFFFFPATLLLVLITLAWQYISLNGR